MKNFRIAAIAALGLLGVAAAGTTASAMPLAGLDTALARGEGISGQIEQVAWVCGPYRCHHVYGGPRPYYYGPPRWHGGWHHGWRRW